jgi:TRAF3-interacting protein 1
MADYCAATRQAFDGLFTKPVLTDKLLQRPPFKFIGDVITSAIKAGSFGNKLFVGELADVALIKGGAIQGRSGIG